MKNCQLYKVVSKTKTYVGNDGKTYPSFNYILVCGDLCIAIKKAFAKDLNFLPHMVSKTFVSDEFWKIMKGESLEMKGESFVIND